MVVGEAWLRKIPERFLRANEGGLRGRRDTLPFPMGVPFFLPKFRCFEFKLNSPAFFAGKANSKRVGFCFYIALA